MSQLVERRADKQSYIIACDVKHEYTHTLVLQEIGVRAELKWSCSTFPTKHGHWTNLKATSCAMDIMEHYELSFMSYS